MARQDAYSITTDGSTADKLAEIYGQVIERVQARAISSYLKNTNLSGDPQAGSVEVKRFKNSVVAEYGTARGVGKGTKLTNGGVTINLDKHKEIVEEIEGSDVAEYGVADIMARRAADNEQSFVAELDRAFFTEAESAASEIDNLTGADVEADLESIIASIMSTKNDYVDGVDREQIAIALKPTAFGKIAKIYRTIKVNGLEDNLSAVDLNGVLVYPNSRQTADVVAMVIGSVAQPVAVKKAYTDEKIPLSNSHAVELFFDYGTKAVSADLIKKATFKPAGEA